MKLLFYYTSERVFHDNEGNLYTSGNFTPEVWNRYLVIGDELHVMMTDSGVVLDKEIAEKTKQKVDITKIHMHLIPDKYASLKTYFSIPIRKTIHKIQQEVFSISDFAIIRAANSPGLALYRKTGKPYAVEVVGCPWDAFWNHDIKGKILAPYQYLYSRYEVSKAKWALYVTKYFLQKRYPCAGEQVNCSNVSLIPISNSILDERIAKIEKLEGKIVIGTAAALNVRYKGQQYVIEALGRLKKQGLCNFEYQLIGGGDQEYLKQVAVQNNVQEEVKIIGQMSHDKVFEWLKNIDLYIQPSLQEGLPRSVIEAMSFGISSAGTRVAGIPELLQEDMMFDGKDVKGIVRILKNLNKERMLVLAKENFEKAKDYYVDVLITRRTNFYRNFRKYSESF